MVDGRNAARFAATRGVAQDRPPGPREQLVSETISSSVPRKGRERPYKAGTDKEINGQRRYP
jgi:hypothetical protein